MEDAAGFSIQDGAQDFDIIFIYWKNVSVSIAFFILKIYFGVGVSLSWRDLESLNLLDGKVFVQVHRMNIKGLGIKVNICRR